MSARPSGPDCARPYRRARRTRRRCGCSADGLVAGCYLHGLFASRRFSRSACSAELGSQRPRDAGLTRSRSRIPSDALADHLAARFDLDRILEIRAVAMLRTLECSHPTRPSKPLSPLGGGRVRGSFKRQQGGRVARIDLSDQRRGVYLRPPSPCPLPQGGEGSSTRSASRSPRRCRSRSARKTSQTAPAPC